MQIVELHDVSRIFRYNKCETNIVISIISYSQTDLLILVQANNFPDALAARSYAAKEGYPILLTDGNRLTKTTMDHIIESGVENIILVDGTSVISQVLEDQLKAMGISITRKSGKNRFDTSLEIARIVVVGGDAAVVNEAVRCELKELIE